MSRVNKMTSIQKTSSESRRARVVNIVTSSLTVRFLAGQPQYLGRKELDVTIVSSPGLELMEAKHAGVHTIAVPMEREISLWKDMTSLWRLCRVIARLRPTVTNVATPKAGLLGGIAAWMGRVPCRYYTLLGLRCETTTGLKRQLLLLTERIACRCAHQVICVSESLQRKAIDLGVVSSRDTSVLASGSYTGIDPSRFAPTADVLSRARRIREDLLIEPKTPVIGFVGRLTKDKGVSELVQACFALRSHFPELRLLLVGDMEEGDPLPVATRHQIESEAWIIRTGFVQDLVPYYYIMDILGLPTHREGFSNVALEAQACGKPVISTRATGAMDSVIDGVTGILVPVGDSRALSNALNLLLTDPSLAKAMGSAGRAWVLREFPQEKIWDALVEEYFRVLSANGLANARTRVPLRAQREIRSVFSS
jgi:glycosyltransferase involved in cell wall biosynthesis